MPTRRPLAALGLGVCLALPESYAVGQQVDPDYANHCDPTPIGGKVDSRDASFYYLSDVEDCGSGLPLMVPRVRNLHRESLIFDWVAGETILIRDYRNPLPPGETEDGSYPVCSYDVSPDTSSLIRYTQQGRQRRAAAYKGKYDCHAQTDSRLESRIRTSYLDPEEKVRRVSIALHAALTDESYHYVVEQELSSVHLAIGGMIDPIFKQSEQVSIFNTMHRLRESLLYQGIEVSAIRSKELFSDSRFATQVPDLFVRESFLLLNYDKSQGVTSKISWELPRSPNKNELIAGVPVVLLDENMRVIAAGTFSIFVPE